MILVISDSNDGHIPLVQRHLDRELIIIDPASVPQQTGLGYSFTNGKLTVSYGDRTLKSVASVWYRKPGPYRKDMLPGVKERYTEYALDSLRRHFSLLRACFTDALWVSDYYNILRAEDKTLQYQAAAAVGLRVPDTLATSNSHAAKEFLESGDKTVVKRFGTITPDGSFFPTTNVDADLSLDGLHLAPAVFQRKIMPKVELRVTVVGHQVFPAAIRGVEIADRPDIRDWRIGQLVNKQRFVPYENLQENVRRACVALVHRMGLQYGAIDLIIDEQDKVWFLEINPNGQWGFVEDDTGLPIGKSLADLLSGKAPSL
jgi:hypothetical protein